MRKLTVFLTSVAFSGILGTSAFAQPEKISLKWLQNQLKVYNAHYVPGEGLKGSSFNNYWNWGTPTMPMSGVPISERPITIGGVIFEEAWFDPETKKCRIKGYNAISHYHAYDDSTYYHTNGLRPGKDCYAVHSDRSCSEFESLPTNEIYSKSYSEKPFPYLIAHYAGPCYSLQRSSEIFLFERDFYWGEIHVPNYPFGIAISLSPWGTPPPKPKIYSTTLDNIDNSKNKGYPALVKKIKIGSTDSLGKFDIEFTLNKNQHILFGGINGESGFDLRQLFVQNYKEHPHLSGEKKFMDSVFRLTPTLTEVCPDYLFYECHFRNFGDCDLQIKNISPAYGFMKARPYDECGTVKAGSCTKIILYFPKNRLNDITDKAFTLFVSTDKGAFSFPAAIDLLPLK